MMEKQDIVITIKSCINGEMNVFETTGEYGFDGQKHFVAYTDYTGNVITKNGLYIEPDKMLLHRVGGITGDMLFDRQTDTIARYNAFMVNTSFVIHTSEYYVEKTESGLSVHISYRLNDGTGSEEITGIQDIEIKM